MWLGRDGSRRARGDDGFEKSDPQPDDWRLIGDPNSSCDPSVFPSDFLKRADDWRGRGVLGTGGRLNEAWEAIVRDRVSDDRCFGVRTGEMSRSVLVRFCGGVWLRRSAYDIFA